MPLFRTPSTLALLVLDGSRDRDIKEKVTDEPFETLAVTISFLFGGEHVSYNFPTCELFGHCVPGLMAMPRTSFGKYFMPHIWL